MPTLYMKETAAQIISLYRLNVITICSYTIMKMLMMVIKIILLIIITH